jgi:hypothetical protein
LVKLDAHEAAALGRANVPRQDDDIGVIARDLHRAEAQMQIRQDIQSHKPRFLFIMHSICLADWRASGNDIVRGHSLVNASRAQYYPDCAVAVLLAIVRNDVRRPQ